MDWILNYDWKSSIERKLRREASLKKQVVRKLDWRKVENLFSGWGRNGNRDVQFIKKDVALSVIRGRMVYWRSTEEDIRKKTLRYEKSLKWQLRDRYN